MEIRKKITTAEFQRLLNQHPSALIYFYQDSCGVCKILLPKVRELVDQNFPKMKLLVIEASPNRELTAQLSMLSVPGIMGFFGGKEYLRSNGLLSIGDLKAKIGRLYEMFY